MDYTPRFSQPFSLQEAIGLDVAVISEEIARLQNSLKHLEDTQAFLQADLGGTGESDSEIKKAFEENQVVIGSQRERISILKMALAEKGIIAGSHYDPPSAPHDLSTHDTQTTPNESAGIAPSSTMTADDNDGVYL